MHYGALIASTASSMSCFESHILSEIVDANNDAPLHDE
jgi:hypothetical protein